MVTSAVGLKKGATVPYTIKGKNLNLVVSIRYNETPLTALHYAKDFTAVTIDQLPAGFTANTGRSLLEFRLTDGTKLTYGVVITP